MIKFGFAMDIILPGDSNHPAKQGALASTLLLIIGLASLLFGFLVYIYTRECAGCGVELIAGRLGFPSGSGHMAIPRLPGWLPSGIHVFGFALITNALLTTKNELKGFCVMVWTFINLLFELMQSDLAYQAWVEVNRALSLEMVSHWPMGGTFCPFDLASAGAGGAVAYMTISLLRR